MDFTSVQRRVPHVLIERPDHVVIRHRNARPDAVLHPMEFMYVEQTLLRYRAAEPFYLYLQLLLEVKVVDMFLEEPRQMLLLWLELCLEATKL